MNRWATVRRAALFALLLHATGPAALAGEPPVAAREGLNATLWMQTAHEYAFSARQTYRAASAALPWARWLPSALVDAGVPLLPPDAGPAIIVDLDETVLDNSRYQAALIENGRPHSAATWEEWVVAGQATALPGSLAFLTEATDQGYRVYYVTNRACPDAGRPDVFPHPACPQRRHTLALAQRLRLPHADDPGAFLFRNDQTGWESGDKSARRIHLAARHKVVMLIGDDLGDFLPADQLGDLRGDRAPQQTVSETPTDPAFAMRFGVQWFLLPNPAYGSWERMLPATPGADRGQRLRDRYEQLLPFQATAERCTAN